MAAFRKAASVLRVTDVCLQNLHTLWILLRHTHTHTFRALHCDVSFLEVRLL